MLNDAAAVFFDAGYTLLEPAIPIHEIYLGHAREVGAELDPAEFSRHLRATWKRVIVDFRSNDPELKTSDELEYAAWDAFTKEVARPFPDLFARHEPWLAAIVAHFDAPASWRPLPGAMAVLEHLQAVGVRAAVVSNWHTALHAILKHHGIADLCAFVLTSAEAGRKKPHPAIFQEALARFQVRAGGVIHVGDSVHDDVQGAINAGIRPILVEAPFRDAEAPAGVTVVRTLNDLLRC